MVLPLLWAKGAPNVPSFGALADRPPPGDAVWGMPFFRIDGVLTHFDICLQTGASSFGWAELEIVPSTGPNLQAAWFINPSTGNDNAIGDAGHPLRTWAELRRRILAGGGFFQHVGETLVTIVGTLPLTDPFNMVGLSVGPGGALRVINTAKTTVYTGSITAITALATATNVQWDITDAAIPVSWTALGAVGLRGRITSGARAGATFMVVKDLGAKKARISDPVIVSSAFPFNVFGTPTYPTLQVGDPFVIESLGQITTVYVEQSSGAPATSADLACRLVFEDVLVPWTTGINGARFDHNYGIAFINSDAQGVIPGFGGFISYFGGAFFVSSEPGNGGGGAYIGSFGAWSPFGFYVGAGVQFAPDHFLAGDGPLVDFIVEGAVQSFSPFGVYDSPSVGVVVRHGGNFYTSVGSNLYGSGNATYGIQVQSGSQLAYGGAKPAITGATNDTIIGGVATAYAGVPAVTAANNAAIVVNA